MRVFEGPLLAIMMAAGMGTVQAQTMAAPKGEVIHTVSGK